jgi:uncharacterized protein (TIGR03435 family)
MAVVCLAGVVQALAAQTSPSVAFEAASIKPNDSGAIRRLMGVPGDRFVATNETLWRLITVAYGAPGFLPQPLSEYQISGGPSWIDSDRFDIDAKAVGDALRGSDGTRRKLLMLQTLLAQRFKLAVHHEMRKMPVYALVFARRNRTLGPELRKPDVDCVAFRRDPGYRPKPLFGTPAFDSTNPDPCGFGIAVEGVLKGGMTMTDLTATFSKWLNRAVVDRTGLTGSFDVDLQFSFEGLPGTPTLPPGVDRPANENPSIFTAVQEQLGLKLESTTGPVDVLVIDHAEKPTPN